MSNCCKRVVYLSYMEFGSRVKGAGFVKEEHRGNEWAFDMHISGMTEWPEKKYEICAVDKKGDEYGIGSVFLHKGTGQWKREGKNNEPVGKGISCDEIVRLVVRISGDKMVEGKLQRGENGTEEERTGPENAEKTEENKRPKMSRPEFIAAEKWKGEEKPLTQPRQCSPAEKEESGKEKKIRMEEMILNDKWEQLCHMYPIVHPYEDEREYISIQPKDFVIMTGDFQHLANNSFLLHGFYNYRHIVLGKEWREEKEGEEAGEDFYLGVPGVYYEREKMVALMFGFEAFECSGGKAEPGKFGYYLRRVKI